MRWLRASPFPSLAPAAGLPAPGSDEAMERYRTMKAAVLELGYLELKCSGCRGSPEASIILECPVSPFGRRCPLALWSRVGPRVISLTGVNFRAVLSKVKQLSNRMAILLENAM